MELSAYEALKSLFELELGREDVARASRNWTTKYPETGHDLENGAVKAAATFMFSEIGDLGRRGDEENAVATATAAIKNLTNEEYEQFLADLWVGIVLTLMVLSCICCMCSCLLYHKFQQWKRTIFDNRNPTQNHHQFDASGESESLPSYTIVSGLPSYEEALEQLRQVKTLSSQVIRTSTFSTSNLSIPINPPPSIPPPSTPQLSQLSVVDLINIYKNNTNDNKT